MFESGFWDNNMKLLVTKIKNNEFILLCTKLT